MKIIGGKNKMDKEKAEKPECPDEKDTKIEELKNQLLRLMADFDNFKKRAAAEKEEIAFFSNEALIIALLPIMDNFERAMDHASSCNKEKVSEEFFKGFALIKKQLEDVLLKIGVCPIDCAGKPFDPNFHEAVITKAVEGLEDGTVAEEMQKGYTFRGKLIRPSMVIVSKNP